MVRYYQRAIAGNRALITTNYVLAELVALLTTRSRGPRADLLSYFVRLRTAPQIRIVHIDPDLDAQAWDPLDRQVDKEHSLVDASSFVVMRRFGIHEAFTSDHHFAQAGFLRVP